jgi:hypothetical protein
MRIRIRKRTAARGEFGNQGGRHKVNHDMQAKMPTMLQPPRSEGGERRYASNGSSEEDPSEDEEHDAGAVRAPSCNGKHFLHLAS